jgi:glycosyltransferase involved in cell wall biosynthesis
MDINDEGKYHMRVGMNPFRTQINVYHPARVTICLLVFIPEQIGYFAWRFEVFKLCFQSIIKNTDHPYDILIFDNGSCSEVVDYLRSLQDSGIIQYLILSSQNIGIAGAIRIMFKAAPGEVLAYSQDDIFFQPGWLQAHLQILDNFPKVGMVSGSPVREQFRYGNQYLQSYLSEYPNVSFEYGHFIPDKWERDFYTSTGRDADECMKTARLENKDILLEYKGIQAYSTAVHFQYIVLKDVMMKGLGNSWEPRLMAGPDVELDNKIDQMGYARLSTFQRYTQHLGNVITPELEKSISLLVPLRKIKTWAPPGPFIEKLIRGRIIRGILARLYNWSYFLLRSQQMK